MGPHTRGGEKLATTSEEVEVIGNVGKRQADLSLQDWKNQEISPYWWAQTLFHHMISINHMCFQEWIYLKFGRLKHHTMAIAWILRA